MSDDQPTPGVYESTPDNYFFAGLYRCIARFSVQTGKAPTALYLGRAETCEMLRDANAFEYIRTETQPKGGTVTRVFGIPVYTVDAEYHFKLAL